jgi:hypothetical protein
MNATDEFLLAVVSKVEPTKTQVDAASRSQNFLRNLLHDSRLPVLDSYLSGSYARDTALRPIDDVDIVFLIDPSYWLKNSLLSFGKPDPNVVLDSFARAIRYRYDSSSVYVQRRSVNLNMDKLDIDVVPAISAGSNTTAIYVADRTDGGWTLSNPKEHTRKASEVNGRRDGLFKPLVKIVKLWNAGLPSTAQVKSFLVETIAVHLFSKYSFSSLSQGLIYFWDHLAFASGERSQFTWTSAGIFLSWWNRAVPDTAATGGNVAAKLDSERCQKLVKCAIQARDSVLLAEKARSEERAIELLRKALRV